MNLTIACATCQGTFMHAGGDAAGWSIFFLLCVIVPVLGAIGFYMIRIIRRQEALDPELCDDYVPGDVSPH